MALTTLFDKFTNDYTSYDSLKIVVAGVDYKVNYYRGWFCVIEDVEYEIISNTATEIFFNNSLTSAGSFEIVFIGREFLKRVDSDYDNLTLIPNSLIIKKYLLTSNFIQIKVEESLKKGIKENFEPKENILNIGNLQYTFAYYISQSVYFDLSGTIHSSQYIEKSIYFDTQYNSSIKSALSSLIIDVDKDGIASVDEKKTNIGSYRLIR
jgi:hypothetical protein